MSTLVRMKLASAEISVRRNAQQRNEVTLNKRLRIEPLEWVRETFPTNALAASAVTDAQLARPFFMFRANLENAFLQAEGLAVHCHSRKQCFRLAETSLLLDRVKPITISDKSFLICPLSRRCRLLLKIYVAPINLLVGSRQYVHHRLCLMNFCLSLWNR